MSAERSPVTPRFSASSALALGARQAPCGWSRCSALSDLGDLGDLDGLDGLVRRATKVVSFEEGDCRSGVQRMVVRPLLTAAVLVVALLRGGCAAWTEEQCAQGIANIATEARGCQEQAAGAGWEISGEMVRGEPACSEVSVREADLVLLR